MKTIGLLGGMSWESTSEYYKVINEGIKDKLGGLHSAKIALYSIDFDPMEKLQQQKDWEGSAEILIDAAQRIQAAGADFLLICTNTMHKVADQVEEALKIPLLHIADSTAEILVEKGIKKVGLLGTAFTMEEDFYRGRMKKQYGLEIITPGETDRAFVHKMIYQELCLGQVKDKSKIEFLRIIESMSENGAEGVILGCTEIGMLVNQGDTSVTLFDTVQIHASKAVEMALSE